MADEEIKKVRKQILDELKQAQKEEKKIRAEFNSELEESTVGTTKEFKNVISSLAINKTRGSLKLFLSLKGCLPIHLKVPFLIETLLKVCRLLLRWQKRVGVI